MLTRIVRLSFEPSKIDDFKVVFNATKDKIANFDGCKGVELMQDVDFEHVFYTYSKWETKTHLENYRNSELFEMVWKKTKVLFNDKPLAYSLKNA